MERVAYFLLLVAIILAVAHFWLARGFRARILAMAGQIARADPAGDALASLPRAVAAFALRSGAKPDLGLRSATLTQSAELRLERGGQFKRYETWQIISLGTSAFLWEARQPFGPATALRVVDGLVGGAGLLEARLLGSIPVAEETGAELTLGEAYRYLAELPWAPDAILGNRQIVWNDVDDRHVEAALETSGGRAVVRFAFDDGGDICEVRAEARPARDAKGRATRLDWVGRFADYRQMGPRRIPARAEVGYVYPDGYETYFRGVLTTYALAA